MRIKNAANPTQTVVAPRLDDYHDGLSHMHGTWILVLASAILNTEKDLSWCCYHAFVGVKNCFGSK